MNPDKQLEKLKTIIDVLDTDRASVDETAEAFQAVLEIIKNLKDTIDRDMASNKGEMDDLYACVLEEIKKTETRMSKMSDRLESKIDGDKIILQQQIIKEVNSLRDLIPTLPDLTYLENRIDAVENLIPKIPDEISGENVRDKLELLKGEARLDKSAVKGLDEELKRIESIKSKSGGGTSAIGVRQVFKYIFHTEEPVGLINGVNTTYTVSSTIWAIIGFTLNGESIAELPNYTFANNKITFSSALPAAYSGKDFEIKYIG